jgi:farnesyl-diphosphate farnesyltransferase
MSPVVAIIAAMPEEVSALQGRLRDRRRIRAGRTPVVLGTLGDCPVAVAVIGDGAANARRGTTELLRAVPVRRALLVGVGGALSPELRPAALVVARAVVGTVITAAAPAAVQEVALATGALTGLAVTVTDLVETPADKARLRSTFPDEPLVVDLESAAVVSVLAAVGIPWIVLRAVSDTAGEALPGILRRCRDEDGLHRARLVAAAARTPRTVVDLWRLGRRMRLCASALAIAVEQVLSHRRGESPTLPAPAEGITSPVEATRGPRMTNLETLLAKTSRTFALSICFLPEALRREVTIAYLLFRIADTLEDADRWSRDTRAQGLDDLARVLARGDAAAIEPLSRQWMASPPVTHAGYLELLSQSRLVLEELEALPESDREVIRKALLATIVGMKGFLAGVDGQALRLGSLDELRSYCHVVAGIVGEMLTELALLHEPALQPVGRFLEERANRFGEALQLINILKDRDDDAAEGRHYLPPNVPISEVVALARRSLQAAEEYTDAIQRAGVHRLLGFHLLLVRLGRASLDRVEQHGPGAKISRLEVMAIVTEVQAEIANAQAGAPESTISAGDA